MQAIFHIIKQKKLKTHQNSIKEQEHIKNISFQFLLTPTDEITKFFYNLLINLSYFHKIVNRN